MKLRELRLEIQEMLCAHEAYRRLGFPADDIFITVGVDPSYGTGPLVFVDLLTREIDHRTDVFTVKTFSLRVCSLWCDDDTLRAEWGAAVALWNDPGRRGECQTIWDVSEMNTLFPELAAAIRRKGLRLPAVDAIVTAAKASGVKLVTASAADTFERGEPVPFTLGDDGLLRPRRDPSRSN